VAGRSIKIVDSTFSHCHALGLAGENIGQAPSDFRWDFTPGPADVKIFTDIRLSEALNDTAKIKIGLLVESPAIAEVSHYAAFELRDTFDVIFTHSKNLLSTGEPFKFYPLGGSWIKEWSVFPKTELVSIITGAKHKTLGQKLRHHAAIRYTNLAIFGQPYTGYFPSKVPMLRPFRYSVVIENGKEDYYFSEKLIDCLSQGTIPIYWGCPSIGSFFDMDGIIPFHELDELGNILQQISAQDYLAKLPAVNKNLELARDFRCAEDWIWRHYEGVFNG
jgi:hypothetical protein